MGDASGISKGLLQEAREFLLQQLSAGPRYSTEIHAAADDRGLKWMNVKRAVAQMGIKSGREQVEGVWQAVWFLPAQEGATVTEDGEKVERPAKPAGTSFGLDIASEIEVRKRIAKAPAGLANLARTLDNLRQQGQGAEIWRYVDGQAAYVTTIPVAQFNLQWVKAKLGGGRFNVAGHDFQIEGEPRDYTDDVPQRVAVAAPISAPAPPAPAAPIGQEFIMQMFMKQQDLINSFIAGKVGASTTDPMEMALKIAAMLHQAPPPVTPVDQAMALLEKGMKLGAEASGADDDGMGRVAKMAEPLMAWLTQAAKNNTSGTKPRRTLVNPPAPDVPMRPLREIAGTMIPHLPGLISQARQGTSVNDVADFILDSTDDPTYAALDAQADGPNFHGDFFDVISHHIPPETVPWFTSLLIAVRRELVDRRRDPVGPSEDSGPQ